MSAWSGAPRNPAYAPRKGAGGIASTVAMPCGTFPGFTLPRLGVARWRGLLYQDDARAAQPVVEKLAIGIEDRPEETGAEEQQGKPGDRVAQQCLG